MSGTVDEREKAEREVAFATAAVRATVIRLCEAEVDLRLVARLLARVAGELGAAAALADGAGVEAELGKLVAAMRQAGRKH